MRLTAFMLPDRTIEMRPAQVDRAWMDATGDRYAYRCLPLAIANAHGWEILCPSGFTAIWDGSGGKGAIRFTPDDEGHVPAVSHFGYGIMTFHLPCIFRTEPGFDIMVQGPVNRPKDGIGALSGVVETDWAPFTFTMNWQFTRPGAPVRFEKGEPFCHIFPIRRGELEQFRPDLRDLADNPELKAQFDDWTASRAKFIADIADPESNASREKWQKHYYRGTDLAGAPVAGDDHRTRVRAAPFERATTRDLPTAKGLTRWRLGLSSTRIGIGPRPVKPEDGEGV